MTVTLPLWLPYLLLLSIQVLLGRPLFPGKNVVHQLELITDLLGSPSPDIIAKVITIFDLRAEHIEI
jgi:hypothetical protein